MVEASSAGLVAFDDGLGALGYFLCLGAGDHDEAIAVGDPQTIQESEYLPVFFVLDGGALREFVAYCRTFGKLNAQMNYRGLEAGAVIAITDGIYIDDDEIVFKVSRSSGPGGQNVNKVNTRVTLFFDVAACETLSQMQKQQVLARLATRSDKNGVLRVASQKFRTQSANRAAAMERLGRLLGEALAPPPIRKRTRTPARAHEKRLEEKKRRSALKKLRSGKDFDF